MIKKKELPIDWLICPFSKEELYLKDNKLYSSSSCYSNTQGFWDFLFEQQLDFSDTDLWEMWNELQKNGEVSYLSDPEANLAIGPLKEFVDFAEFSVFRGNILDIGVGPQKLPTHMEHSNNDEAFFVGLDPLVGSQPRDFTFVRALGEYLPFKNEIFDQVLFVTSLDHFIDPRDALEEAKRVMKKDGELLVVMGEKSEFAPRPAQNPQWYESLQVPKGADDKFHYKKFGTKEFQSFLRDVELEIVELHRQPVRDWADAIHDKIDLSGPIWGESLFYRISK